MELNGGEPGGLAPAGRRVVLLDGGSGAGKTTIAERLARAWQQDLGEPVQLVHLDEVYPGWHGLAAAQRVLVEQVLRPVGPGYHRWDWERGRPAEWVALDPRQSLLVEGCGALFPASAELADLCLWVELDEPTRRHRALARDGDAFRPWWQVWAEQEQEHWRRHRPRALADLVLAPGQPPETLPGVDFLTRG